MYYALGTLDRRWRLWKCTGTGTLRPESKTSGRFPRIKFFSTKIDILSRCRPISGRHERIRKLFLRLTLLLFIRFVGIVTTSSSNVDILALCVIFSYFSSSPHCVALANSFVAIQSILNLSARWPINII